MNIKVPATELNRMMKAISQCIDPKDQNRSNVEIIYDNNKLTARGTNGQFAAVMSTPLLGGDGESFCVDGSMFARVCSMCTGDVSIVTDDKSCTVKGAGKTRLPIMDAKIPKYEEVEGDSFEMTAIAISRMYDGVSFAISSDASRLVLTGILVENENGLLKMTSLDGFKMASEEAECKGAEVRMVVPGSFMKLVKNNTVAGDKIKFTSNGKRIQAETEGMILSSTLLANEYPDYKRILPTTFKTEALVNLEELRNALKNSSVICSASKLVKLTISDSKITVAGNSEQADYEAEVKCSLQGPELTIAFNQKYLMDTINSMDIGEEIILKFNSPSNPCVINSTDIGGYRLILPVRVAG